MQDTQTARVELANIQTSPLNPRKTFDAAALKELTESVRTHGVLQPILVRKRNGGYEIIAGERRYRAARAAGLKQMDVRVGEFDDEQVLEIQLIENLHRADVHPLEEADGYKALISKHGYAAAQVAKEVGKSPTYIYQRLKLTELSEKARKLFREGKYSTTVALYIARIPDAGLQDKAAEHIVDEAQYMDGDGDARDHIKSTYMLQLAKASFSTSDKELVPEAGACKDCPKRTGKQPELFQDIGKEDLCTDPACFQKKVKAHIKRAIEQAKKRGEDVLEAKEAASARPKGYMGVGGNWTDISGQCEYDEKHRGWAKVLKADDKLRRGVVFGANGKKYTVVKTAELREAMKRLGFKRLPYIELQHRANPAEQARDERKEAIRDRCREMLYIQIYDRASRSKELAGDELKMVMVALTSGYGGIRWRVREAMKRLKINAIPKSRPNVLVGILMEALARDDGNGCKAMAKFYKIDLKVIGKNGALLVDEEIKAAKAKADKEAKAKEKKTGKKKAVAS